MSDGTLAVSVRGGIYYLRDKKIVESYTEDQLPNPEALCMYEDVPGRLVIGTNGSGVHYIENENKIKDSTQKRNHSILAHGLDSQTKEDFDKFLELILTLARKLDKGMNKFLKETKFAKFDLKIGINSV